MFNSGLRFPVESSAAYRRDFPIHDMCQNPRSVRAHFHDMGSIIQVLNRNHLIGKSKGPLHRSCRILSCVCRTVSASERDCESQAINSGENCLTRGVDLLGDFEESRPESSTPIQCAAARTKPPIAAGPLDDRDLLTLTLGFFAGNTPIRPNLPTVGRTVRALRRGVSVRGSPVVGWCPASDWPPPLESRALAGLLALRHWLRWRA